MIRAGTGVFRFSKIFTISFAFDGGLSTLFPFMGLDFKSNYFTSDICLTQLPNFATILNIKIDTVSFF